MHDFADLALFITGPTWIRPEARAAAALPEFGHRDAEANKRFDRIFHGLRVLAGLPAEASGSDGMQLCLIPGSGTNALETAVRSLAADDETVLNVSVGAFGDLFHGLALVNGKRAVQLSFPPGEAMDLATVEDALRQHAPAVVTLSHNETSTGVRHADIGDYCALVRRHGALPLVDGVSIFGGESVDLTTMGAAAYATSTQKCLALPAGLGILFASDDAVEKAKHVKNKGYVTDLTRHLDRAAKHQTLTTPSTSLANQLAVQLDYILHEETPAVRFARHRALRDMVHAFAETLPGYRLLAPETARSPSLTTLRCPDGVDSGRLKQVKETLRARGFLFDTGYGKLNVILEGKGHPPIFRIGHMGDMQPAMLTAFLDLLGPALAEAAR